MLLKSKGLISLDSPFAGSYWKSWWWRWLGRGLDSGIIHITGLAWISIGLWDWHGLSHTTGGQKVFWGIRDNNVWLTGPGPLTRYDQNITCGQTPKNAYNAVDVPFPPAPEKWCYHTPMPQQGIDVKDLKFTACQLIYTFMKAGVWRFSYVQ